ncbi:MAG: peptidoglycan-binding protein [Dehalococcoidia bacterium]|nr:peptidoglycan-binding protein [Dehalococcoidia bacterium]
MEKATIENLDTGEKIPCLFNPNEYTYTKSNSWTQKPVKGENVPDLEFGGGGSATLTMSLFLDTSTTGGDVRDTTGKLYKLMDIDEKATDMTTAKGRPPMVEFHWGRIWSFKAVITSLTEKCTLFRDDGVPVRATVSVTFLQAKEQGVNPPQNPTTAGQPGYKRRLVNEGDTIDWIAFDEYGDSALWRYIAHINNLDDPGRLRPGQMLAIAPRP